jgi:hypothetical protein
MPCPLPPRRRGQLSVLSVLPVRHCLGGYDLSFRPNCRTCPIRPICRGGWHPPIVSSRPKHAEGVRSGGIYSQSPRIARHALYGRRVRRPSWSLCHWVTLSRFFLFCFLIPPTIAPDKELLCRIPKQPILSRHPTRPAAAVRPIPQESTISPNRMEYKMTSSETWLDDEDKSCRADRIARLEWLNLRIPAADIWLFQGGLLSKYLFEEARYCFVYGQFLATTILGFAFVEHTLSAMLFAIGRNDAEKTTAYNLLDEALKLGWISQEQFATLRKARQLRNAVMHFRRPLHQSTIEFRSMTLNEFPYNIVEKDAKLVMETVLEVLKRNSI